MRRGPIHIPDPEPTPEETQAVLDPAVVMLPARPVIDAGTRKFEELLRLHWPWKGGAVAFDVRDRARLMMTLGLVYMAMRQADRPS